MKHQPVTHSECKPLRSKRSREHRRTVAFPAHILLDDGEITQVEVLDLSYDGCSIEAPVALTEGSTVKISVVALGAHDAQVRWYRDGKAGLSFAIHSSWEREYQQRNVERIALEAQISLRRVGRCHYVARVFDLSNQGCKVEFVERPRRDELVWVKFNALEAIEAEVCWVNGFYGGLKFLRPIYPPVFQLLLAKLGVELETEPTASSPPRPTPA